MPATAPGAGAEGSRQPGELTAGWHWVVRLAWLGVIIGFSSVWKASRDIGLPTWWIGELSDPQPLFVAVFPFAAPTAMVALTFGHSRLLPWLGLGASAVTASIGALDLAPYTGLGVVELSLAAAAAAVSLASFGGRYRRADG